MAASKKKTRIQDLISDWERTVRSLGNELRQRTSGGADQVAQVQREIEGAMRQLLEGLTAVTRQVETVVSELRKRLEAQADIANAARAKKKAKAPARGTGVKPKAKTKSKTKSRPKTAVKKKAAKTRPVKKAATKSAAKKTSAKKAAAKKSAAKKRPAKKR